MFVTFLLHLNDIYILLYLNNYRHIYIPLNSCPFPSQSVDSLKFYHNPPFKSILFSKNVQLKPFFQSVDPPRFLHYSTSTDTILIISRPTISSPSHSPILLQNPLLLFSILWYNHPSEVTHEKIQNNNIRFRRHTNK